MKHNKISVKSET